MYEMLNMILYGMLQSSLKFWGQQFENLTTLWCVINPHYWCKANKVVRDKGHVMAWRDDDL